MTRNSRKLFCFYVLYRFKNNQIKNILKKLEKLNSKIKEKDLGDFRSIHIQDRIRNQDQDQDRIQDQDHIRDQDLDPNRIRDRVHKMGKLSKLENRIPFKIKLN